VAIVFHVKQSGRWFSGIGIGGVAALCAAGCDSSGSPAPAPASGQQPSAAPAAPQASASAPRAANADAPAAEEGHVHTAPHGGMLVELGEHFANVEVVFAGETGELTLYLLDAHAENAVRSSQGRLYLAIDALERDGTRETPTDLVIQIPAVESALTGETAEHSSQFSELVKPLRGVSGFEGRLQTVFVQGREFKDVAVKWPD
jgi:hypothetical protein